MHWQAPWPGSLKLNADAGYDRATQVATCEAVVRDHEGVVIVATSHYSRSSPGYC